MGGSTPTSFPLLIIFLTILDVSYFAFHSRAAAEPFQRLVARILRRALIAMELDSGPMAPPIPHIQLYIRRQWSSAESAGPRKITSRKSTRVVSGHESCDASRFARPADVTRGEAINISLQ
jgi:hypothetical protein